jgi:hypothetical protein
VKRNIERDSDGDRNYDQEETRAPTNEASISLPPIEAREDEAIASPQTYTELPDTRGLSP